jgi:iron complex transport system substrate-binding protein
MRIVSLLSSATEMLFAVGAGNDVVAVSHECDYPPQVARLPRATRTCVDPARPSAEIDQEVRRRLKEGLPLYELDQRLICQLAPDLIVTQSQCEVCAIRLSDVQTLVATQGALSGCRVLSLAPATLHDVLADLVAVGTAAGRGQAARDLARELMERVAHIRTQAAQAAARRGRPRVVCLEWTAPLMTAGNWTAEILAMAGGTVCLAHAGQKSGYVTWEQVRQCDPQVLLIAPCGFDLTRSRREAEALVALPGFADLTAVRSGRAWVLDGNAYLNRSGPRLVDSLELVAWLMHPDHIPCPSEWARACCPLLV